MDDESEVYSALPDHIQRKIDKVFYDATRPSNGKRKSKLQRQHPGSPKKRKVTPVDSGGGFIIEDPDEDATGGGGGGFIVDDATGLGTTAGGGFIVNEDQDDIEEKPGYISLSNVPNALHLLNLSPDDAQVMGVFRRAAADWDELDGAGDVNPHGEAEEGLVSLTDWRAICGVLLEGADIPEEPESLDLEDFEDLNPPDEYGNDSGDDSDEYVEDKGLPQHRLRRTRGTAGNRARQDSDSSFLSDDDSLTTKSLTSKQRQTCLQTFALFFDATADKSFEELSKKRLRISDLQHVAGLLKEKLKVEEMIEMLETFSTSPDKSMSLEDFEVMMVRAKLV
ncbi:hypothetical protein L218DRAFT_938940 [Marasmius fiardii PR-910]|nr:hypothetical protein L218DRAFT_938940 [Marasmius fiardii PR-910]